MNDLTIRKTKPEDLPRLLEIYETAKKYMRAEGNMNQWVDGYPDAEILSSDIAKGNSYAIEKDGCIVAAFTYIVGADPTYAYIEDGAWLDDEKPYGTIHRIASDGTVKGIMPAAVDFCFSRLPNLRVDTHADNKTMQHQILKCGFTRCGIIFIGPEVPRIAYQKI